MLEQQLTLPVRLHHNATFSNFFGSQNNDLIKQLKTSSSSFYLWGSEGVGKSHLLQASCNEAKLNNKLSSYLSLAEPELNPSVLENFDEMALVCLDDLDKVIGIREWEEALFHLYNHLKDKQACLIVAATKPLKQLNCCLPDLESRLSWGMVYQVHGLTDNEKFEFLQLCAKQKGLILSEESANFLLRRCSRDMSTLSQILEELDNASLQSKRPLSIPFIKSVLKI